MDLKTEACNIFDLREMAKQRVPRGPFEFMKFIDPTLRPRAVARPALRAFDDKKAVGEA